MYPVSVRPPCGLLASPYSQFRDRLLENPLQTYPGGAGEALQFLHSCITRRLMASSVDATEP